MDAVLTNIDHFCFEILGSATNAVSPQLTEILMRDPPSISRDELLIRIRDKAVYGKKSSVAQDGSVSVCLPTVTTDAFPDLRFVTVGVFKFDKESLLQEARFFVAATAPGGEVYKTYKEFVDHKNLTLDKNYIASILRS